MKPSERFELDAVLIREFRDAYVDLLNSARPDNSISMVTVSLRPNVDNETWQQKRIRVAQAAGAAALAYSKHGGTFALRNAAYIMHDVDPVTNWEMSLRDPEQLRPEVVVSTVESADARARQLALEAKRRERGVTGLIASFLRWPSNLREAVGPGHRAQRQVAGVIGFLGQILAAALATAIAAAVVAGSVAIWHSVTDDDTNKAPKPATSTTPTPTPTPASSTPSTHPT